MLGVTKQIIYFNTMKTMFILIASLVLATPLLSQTGKLLGVPLPQNKVMNAIELNAYLDSLAKIHQGEAENTPSNQKRPFRIMKDKNGYTIVKGFNENLPELNQMPVLKPDSDYVYQMPGTFAFDQKKLKNEIAQFVKPQVIPADKSPLQQYFEQKDRVQKPAFIGKPLPKK